MRVSLGATDVTPLHPSPLSHPPLMHDAMQDKNYTSKVQFLEEVAKPMLALEGDRLPVSVFQPGGWGCGLLLLHSDRDRPVETGFLHTDL